MKRPTKRPPPRRAYKPTFLREWRDRAGLSQEDAAPSLGITHGQLSRIERGESPYSQRILEAAAKLYGCTEPDLLTRGPNDAEELFGLWTQLDSPQRQRAARVIRALKDDGE